MNLPTLPTDNLYKFLALSGLALLLFSMVYPLNTLNDLELKAVEARTQIKLLELELSVLERNIDAASRKKEPSPDEVARLSDRQQQLKAKAIQNEGERERLTTLVKQLRFAFNGLIGGLLIGYALAHLGFYLWYVRVQKPADKLARTQGEAKDA